MHVSTNLTQLSKSIAYHAKDLPSQIQLLKRKKTLILRISVSIVLVLLIKFEVKITNLDCLPMDSSTFTQFIIDPNIT